MTTGRGSITLVSELQLKTATVATLAQPPPLIPPPATKTTRYEGFDSRPPIVRRNASERSEQEQEAVGGCIARRKEKGRRWNAADVADSKAWDGRLSRDTAGRGEGVPTPNLTVGCRSITKDPPNEGCRIEKTYFLMKSVVYEVLRVEPPVPSQYAKTKCDFMIESHDAAFKIRIGTSSRRCRMCQRQTTESAGGRKWWLLSFFRQRRRSRKPRRRM